ncbi:MAG: hypothetical protein PHU47_00005, partial [Candidatus ainarchaeum sp.]|nr:hypothetical protein [Candidatus ainarchaeum sp.]
MNKKIILLISMFMMVLVLGSNVFAAKVGDVRGIDGIESVTTQITGENTCSVTIRLKNTPLITPKEELIGRIFHAPRTYYLCPHYMIAHSNYTISVLFPKLKSFVNNNKWEQGNRSTYENDNWIYFYKYCNQTTSGVRFNLTGNICKSEMIDVFVFMPFVHVDSSSYNDIWYAKSTNPASTDGAHNVELGNGAVTYFTTNTTQSNYKKLNAAALFNIELNTPAQTPTTPETNPDSQDSGAGSTGAGGAGDTGGAGSTGAGGTGGNGGDSTANGTNTKSHLQACKDLGYVEHPSYPVGLADGVPVGDGRTKTAEPGDYLYKCEESSVFGNTIRVTRCNPYTGDFGLGAGEPRGEVAISELHEQLCQEIEQIRRAEEEQREAELYDTININYHIKQLDKVIEAKEDPIELSYNPEKTIFYLNYNRPAVVLNNLDLNFVLPQDFNSDKNTCYLITSIGQNTQVDINTFFDKFTQENNYIEDSNALSNVNCNQITENNVMLRAARMEEKYFLALQKIDDTNILVTSAQIKFMNRELYLSYLRYEINKKIARFFCPSCNLPSIETPTEETQTFTYPQKTLRVLKEEVPVVADVDETAQTGNLITSFIINEVNGVINNPQNAIKVTLPEGTDVTNLIPTITISEGATVNPESGVAQNFTDPVNYTVTPETGDQKVYTVVVNHSISEGGGAGDITLEKAANGCYTSNTASIAILRGEDIGKTKTYFTQRRTASSIPYNSDPNNTNTNPSLTIAQINTILSNRTNYE